MFPLINTLPELSAKKPLLVVAVVVASATLPTFIVPAAANWTLPPVSVPAASVNPPIVPDLAVSAPAFVTLNTELAPNAIPSVPIWTPALPSSIAAFSPIWIFLSFEAIFTKVVPLPTDRSNSFIVNPPIVPPASAVIVPCRITSPSSCSAKLDDDISKLPLLPLI